MTIREIAKIAGVSPTTVSKIINGKDDSISPVTREKVLEIVKEHNYAPSYLSNGLSKTYMAGILLRKGHSSPLLAEALALALQKDGYHAVLAFSDGTESDRLKHLEAFSRLGVDAVISEDVPDEDIAVPSLDILSDYEMSYADEYKKLLISALEEVAGHGHTEIAVIVRSDSVGSVCARMCEYLKNSHLTTFSLENLDLADPEFLNKTAVICQDAEAADEVRVKLSGCGRYVPRDMSLIAMSFEDKAPSSVSSMNIPLTPYARKVASTVIRKAEKLDSVKSVTAGKIPQYFEKGTVTAPRTVKIPRIVSIGTINMDIYASVDSFPVDGLSVKATPIRKLPGGKAFNQAVAAARLGADVTLVGRVGNDDYGREIYRMVTDVTGHNSGIVTDAEKTTGVAYVLTRKDSASSVILYPGANEKLDFRDVADVPDLFHNADFCLLHTEMALDKVEEIAREAHRNNCRVILKPCGIKSLPESLLEYIDYLVPNKDELGNILGGGDDMEADVSRFIDRYKGTVIVTCASEGAYVFAPDGAFRCTALNAADVDSIGASDIFIGALASSLAVGDTLRNAVVDATYAAGYSITLQGATSAVIDRQLLSALKADKTYRVKILPL